MYKRVVRAYVEDELKKGKTIEQIRKRLIKVGYKERDVDEILRSFEFRERDLRNRREKLAIQRTKVNVLLAVILIISIINLAFFLSYFSSPNYVLVRETPTGFVTQDITKEELRNLEGSLNVSNDSIEGLSKIS